MAHRESTTRGFAQTGALLAAQIRKASEKRGFAQSRVLTHWDEIAGPELAAVSRPVEVRFGRGGLGATLSLLTTGAHAPLLEMQKEQIRARVNAVYGYNAIARIRITQTAATGFAEGQADFTHRPRAAAPLAPDPGVTARAQRTTQTVGDDGLRAALERLATNVISRNTPRGD